jgi:allantoinase
MGDIAYARTLLRPKPVQIIYGRRLLAECTEVLTRLSGRRPEGWLGPYIGQSGATLDLLKESDYRYVMDWAMDDQPV